MLASVITTFAVLATLVQVGFLVRLGLAIRMTGKTTSNGAEPCKLS